MRLPLAQSSQNKCWLSSYKNLVMKSMPVFIFYFRKAVSSVFAPMLLAGVYVLSSYAPDFFKRTDCHLVKSLYCDEGSAISDSLRIQSNEFEEIPLPKSALVRFR